MKTAKAFLISILFISTVNAQRFGEVVGTTCPCYQNNGSAANRIAVCCDSSIYVCWTNLLGLPYPPAPRHVYHNWRSPEGEWNPNGYSGQISYYSPAGFCNLDIINNIYGVITYHELGGYPTPAYIKITIDIEPGLGYYDPYYPPDELFPQTPEYPGQCLYPVLAIDKNNYIHIVMTELSPDIGHPVRMGYTVSFDSAHNWQPPVVVDTVTTISTIITASPVSDRVAIGYLHPHDTSSSWTNNVHYIVSEDGINWNWETGKIKITDYDNYDYLINSGIDVLFDNNDVLHFIWCTFKQGIVQLWHYDELSDTITLIHSLPDSSTYPRMPLSINQPSLSRDENMSNLYAVWCQFNESDTNIYGAPNGELFMSVSSDNGFSWSQPENLTNTQSPGCIPPDCKSEVCPSAAETARYFPYITYIFNPNGGDCDYVPPGTACRCSVMVACPEDYTDIDKNPTNLPSGFYLFQNYPNPFNSSTSIQYSLAEPAVVRLEIYDLLGRQVATLVNQQQPAGRHEIIWDAEEFSSGVYFIRLRAGEVNRIKQCLLLK